VVGVPADQSGGEDEVMVFIVPAAGRQVDFASVADWCVRGMPSFMVPRYFDTLEALPRTPTEKVRKKELREIGVRATTWDRMRARA
jgi:crotonobetaine/carnitine-CoA ligase